MDSAAQQHSRDLIQAYSRRLRVLELKSAEFGLHCPTDILLEIDDLRKKLQLLQQELPHPNIAPQAARKPTILVVDDDRSIVDTITDILTDEDEYQVMTALNGVEALRLAAAMVPDLVLLDINMPGMDGVAVLANLREKGIDTRVIVLTASNTMGLLTACYKHGACDYIDKPFDIEHLLSRIRLALQLDVTIDKLAQNPERTIDNLLMQMEDLKRHMRIERSTQIPRKRRPPKRSSDD